MISSVPFTSTTSVDIAYYDISEDMNWVIIKWSISNETKQTVLYKKVSDSPLQYEYCKMIDEMTTADTTAYGCAVTEKFYIVQDTVSSTAGIVIYKLNKDGYTWELAKKYSYTHKPHLWSIDTSVTQHRNHLYIR
jgi:hypothetical protein